MDKKPVRKFNKGDNRREKEFEERVVVINRVSKTVKGGRKMRFAALVVVGDRKGRVGFGTGKANEVPEAIKKAIENAKKNVFRVSLVNANKTIPHTVKGHFGAGEVLLMPAVEGTGIIAGGAVRSVLELAGVGDVLSKCIHRGQIPHFRYFSLKHVLLIQHQLVLRLQCFHRWRFSFLQMNKQLKCYQLHHR